MLDGLGDVVPADCVALSVWDPTTGGHRTVASSYVPAVTTLIDTRMHTDRLFATVRAGRRPVRVRDLEPALRRGEIFDRIIVPQGFRDGVTLCLFAPDERYVGMLNASTLDARHPDDDTVALLDLLSSDLAAALDPMPSPVARTGTLGAEGTEGLIVERAGRVVPLSAQARADLVHRSSPLADVLAAVLAGGPPPGPVLLVTATGEVVGVEVHATASGVLVLHREVPPPDGLTVRELEVLDGVARGPTPRSARSWASGPGPSPRTWSTSSPRPARATGPRPPAAPRSGGCWSADRGATQRGTPPLRETQPG
ncbi:hypothetical protein C8D89_106191 [Actinomycetospora cinnamomea]|uniref:GAF domain-containing protein n=1 Tax=Actinomycetospora cinnamomea TaxID=663609 RepID=A0A2U1FBG9_9PSEU|nr:hypothetical protein C8D89_106191 [Actinomycetospora cinnamomea]